MTRVPLLVLVLVSSLSPLACGGNDGGDDEQAGSESESETAATDTTDTTDSETGPSCGVAAGVCCMPEEPCEVTEDCCEPATYSCALSGPSYKCIDLAQMCTDCLTNCQNDGVPPDVCTSACAQWCDPP